MTNTSYEGLVIEVIDEICQERNIDRKEFTRRVSWAWLCYGNSIHDLLEQVQEASSKNEPFKFLTFDEFVDQIEDWMTNTGEWMPDDVKTEIVGYLDMYDSHIGGFCKSSPIIG